MKNQYYELKPVKYGMFNIHFIKDKLTGDVAALVSAMGVFVIGKTKKTVLKKAKVLMDKQYDWSKTSFVHSYAMHNTFAGKVKALLSSRRKKK